MTRARRSFTLEFKLGAASLVVDQNYSITEACRANATVEKPDIPSVLNRDFECESVNQVWCGDITYIWTGNRWHNLAAILDLYKVRVISWAMSARPDADLDVKAIDMAFERRGKPQNILFHSDQPIRLTKILAAFMTLSNDTKHKSTW